MVIGDGSGHLRGPSGVTPRGKGVVSCHDV